MRDAFGTKRGERLDYRRPRPGAAGLALRIAVLSVLSGIFGAATFGVFAFGFMGLYVFPIYLLAKWYVFFPVIILFYSLAGLFWKRSDVSRPKYCLISAIGGAVLFSAAGVIMLREFDPMSVAGTLIGGFVPVMLSTYSLSENR